MDMSRDLRDTLQKQATLLNDGSLKGDVVVPLLAAEGLLARGVPRHLGGDGGSFWEAVLGISQVAEECLTSAFMLWAQRVFVEYLVQTDNEQLRSRMLSSVLSGKRSGATGLSNAIKYLCGFEALQLKGVWLNGELVISGHLPWVSNARPDNFIVAVAVQTGEGKSVVAAVPADSPGLRRSEDLALVGLQSSQTAALSFDRVRLPRSWLISQDAETFIPRIRPLFLLLQIGLSLGLTERSLREAARAGELKHRLDPHIEDQQRELNRLRKRLEEASALEHNAASCARLFAIRIALAKLAQEALFLEVQATGGAGYLKDSGVGRRLREVAFLPVVTPSVTQLEQELKRFYEAAA